MFLMIFPPDPLVLIQNNFTELFIMIASSKIAQIVLLRQKGVGSYSRLIQESPEV